MPQGMSQEKIELFSEISRFDGGNGQEKKETEGISRRLMT